MQDVEKNSYTESATELAPLAEESEQHIAMKRAEGRYTLKEAAKEIASNADEQRKPLLQKLMRDAVNTLPVYKPGKRQICQQGGLTMHRSYYEAYWDDLNAWLAENESRITFRFPAPATATDDMTLSEEGPHYPEVGPTTRDPAPIPTPVIASAFAGLDAWSKEQWSSALGDPPDWLRSAQKSKGRPGRGGAATWNPVVIAIALHERGTPLPKLDSVFKQSGMKAWAAEWVENSEYRRSYGG